MAVLCYGQYLLWSVFIIASPYYGHSLFWPITVIVSHFHGQFLWSVLAMISYVIVRLCYGEYFLKIVYVMASL